MRSHINFRWNYYVASFLSLLCTILNFSACYYNSWGIWKTSRVTSFCLPLPPPLGCDGHDEEREVLEEKDANFWFLPLISAFLCATSAHIIIMLPVIVKKFCKVHMGCTVNNFVIGLLLSATIADVLAVMIAAFRMRIVTMVHKYRPRYYAGGMLPAYSTSFHLCITAALLEVLACFFIQILIYDEWNPIKKEKLSHTIKQHLSRNIMYPDDPSMQKMMTFSSMTPEMEEVAANICMEAVKDFSHEEDCAEEIKNNFEERFGRVWFCIVGEQFGSCVEHRAEEYIEVCLPETSVLLYRCDVPDEEE